ncbi:MAG TPA: sulfotransferase, partial [Nostocaceae cyanobacterium]|nr:sulfotransferase [Nostocaceae cyanobacterium]
MTIKVIGAGFGRTGTSSLKAALEELGFNKCYHMIELLQRPSDVTFWEDASDGKPVNWDALFDGYQAIVDFPGYRYYQQLMQHYPDAKVLLSIRDADNWYESTLDTIYKAGPTSWQKLKLAFMLPFSPRLRQLIRVFRMADRDVWQKDFQGKFEDKQLAHEIFHQHIEQVKRVVPSERLLVYQVKEGWQPLCQFLDVPVPDQPFPHLNERAT